MEGYLFLLVLFVMVGVEIWNSCFRSEKVDFSDFKFVNNARFPNIGRISDRRPPIPQDVRRRVFEMDNYKCVYCGSQDCLEIDHIYPWSISKSHHISNLQTLCMRCNRKKSDKIL